MSKSIQNGAFKYPDGTAATGCSLIMRLSQDGKDINNGQIASQKDVTFVLDSSGNIPGASTILANDEITPSGTYYNVEVINTTTGQVVYGPTKWVLTGGSPINLSNMTGTLVDPAWANPCLLNPTGDQTFASNNLLPTANTQQLGSTGARWTVKAQTLDVASTSTLTGAVTAASTLSVASTSALNGNVTLGTGVSLKPTDATGQALGDTTHRMDAFVRNEDISGSDKFSAVAAPTAGAFGQIWYDNTNTYFMVNEASGANYRLRNHISGINTTTVTAAANSAADQNLMAFTIPAGEMNKVGRTLRIKTYGVYSLAANAPTLNLKLKIGSGPVTVFDVISTATTNSAVNAQFEAEIELTTVTAGASGTFEAHGTFKVNLTVANTGVMTTYNDKVTAVSSAIDLTAAATAQMTIASSIANASNSFVNRLLTWEIFN